MTDEAGRGAFTHIGKDNLENWYEFVKGLPLDGSSPEKGFNYEAVHLGVLSIEKRLAELGYDLKVDGIYGPKVKVAVKDFQTQHGLAADGSLGFITTPLLWKPVIAERGADYKFNPSLIFGLMKQESGGDPGAVGILHSPDRGLFQFNLSDHPDVTVEEAHDYTWAVDSVFARFNGAWKKYAGKGMELRTACSIAQHNSPGEADTWFSTGTAPSDRIAGYVEKVLLFSNQY